MSRFSMGDNKPAAVNESFDDWVVAFDKSLAAGDSPPLPPPSLADSKLAEKVLGTQECLQLLEEVYPRSNPERRPSPETTAIHDDSAPRRLGRFELIRELGRGGCGVVYLARDPFLDRDVALKVPHAQALLDAQLRKRFLREAKAAAGIDHPNVVPVYEAGEIGPICYIASAYCAGPTLAEWLKHRTEPVPVRVAVKLVQALAAGVAHLQTRGVWHRDLKPSNVLLPPDDAPNSELGFVPRMTDFGMAKLTNGTSTSNHVTAHTQAGMLVGTPAYMTPEQASGNSAVCGPTTDVYGLGVILYEVLTGRPAFSGDNTIELLKRVAKEDPPGPGRLRRRLHRDLETICTKCLQKEPRRRYESASAFAEDLQRFLDGEPIRARPISRPERVWKWMQRHPAQSILFVAMAFLLLVGLPSALWYAWSLREARETARIADELTSAALSAKMAAEETAMTQSYFSLLMDARNQTSARPLGWTDAGLRDLRQAAILPTRVRDPAVLRSHAATCLAGVDLRLREVLVRDFTAGAVAVSAGGRTLAIGQFKAPLHFLPCQILLVNLEQPQTKRTLTFTPTAMWSKGQRVQDGVRALAFSPDGNKLYAGTRGGFVHCWQVRDAASPPVSWQAHSSPVTALVANDDTLFSSGEDGLVLKWDSIAKNRELARFSFAPRKCEGLCYAPDGKILYASGADKTVWLDASNFTAVRESPALGGPCRTSPGGACLVAADGSNIRLANALDGAIYRSLRDRDDDAVHEGQPDALCFSPNGALVVSVGSAEGDRTVKVWEVADGKLMATLHVGGTGPMCAAFVLGGQGLVVAGDRRVELYDVAGGSVQTWVGHTPDKIRAVAMSPDGSALACITQQGAFPDGHWRGEVHVWDVAENRSFGRRALEGAYCPEAAPTVAFNSDGSMLAYVGHTPAVSVWNWRSEAEPKTWPCVTPRHLDFDAEGSRLWTVSSATDLLALDIADGRAALRWSNAGTDVFTGLSNIYCVAAGRNWALAGGRDGAVRTLNAADGRPHATWRGPGGPVRCLALPTDESIAVVGTQDNIVRVVHVPNGEVITDLRDHLGSIEAVALADSGQMLVTGSRDGNVKVYVRENRSFVALLTLRCGGPVVRMGLSADGAKLGVLVQRENAVRVWHLDRLRTRLTKMDLGW